MSFLAQIQANIDDFTRNLDKAQARLDVFSDTVGKKVAALGSKFQVAGGVMSLGITAPLAAIGTAAYDMAADFEDALGATDQIFQQSSKNVQEWAENLPTYFGIAKKEALEYSNMMGSMLKNIGGLTDKEASKQGAKLIELAGDLTAMYGGTTQDAVRALTGALKGNNTMLDNYGMAANDALVKAKALSLGLVQQGKEMSLSAKQAATLALIYEQSGAAQGQASREAEGASGSMRALRTEITNLTTEIGSALLPVITPLINGIKKAVSGFREMSPETKNLIVIVGGLAAAIGPLLVGLGTIMQLAPLVGAAFTVMTGPVGIAVAAITAAAAAIYYYWDDIKKVVLNTIAAIQQGISKFFNKIAGWASALGFDGMSESLKDLGGEFQTFSNNTTMRANEIGAEIKRTGEETNKTTASTNGLNTALTGLQPELKKTTKDTRDYKTELVNLFADWGVYESQITAITKKFADYSVMAKKAGATTKELDLISRKELGEKLSLALNQFDLKEVRPKLKVNPDIEFDIDTITEKLKKLGYKVVKDLEPIKEEIAKVFNVDIGAALGEMAGNAIESLGTALANGTNIVDAIGKSLLSTLGSLAVNMGKQMIAFGAAALGLQKLLTNPYTAIAAGAALIALGSFASASVSKTVSSATSGGGSSYSSATTGTDFSQFRGALYNNDKQVVQLELRNSKLVGAVTLENKRNNRLG